MRFRDMLLLIVLMLVALCLLADQVEKTAPVPPVSDTRAADLVAELSKFTYTAKRAVPASENIFVEDGRVVEALFALTRQENPTAVAAHRTAAVSKVMLLDKAIHVFFADDKCALLILTEKDQTIAAMTPEQLLKLAQKGIAALFVAKPVAPKPVT